MYCCVVGCDNQHSRNSKLKFYRIPRGFRPLHVKRRQLWLQAIQQANGSHKLQGNAFICGAHFILGEPCMDHDHPDFVPSVFPKRSPSPKKKHKRFHRVFGRRRRRRKSKAIVKTPSEDDSPAEEQSPLVMDETQTSVPKEGETPTKVSETESENNPVNSQTSSSPDKSSSSFKVLANMQMGGKGIPTVLLKSIFTPESGYKCGQCNQVFAIASQLVRHVLLHEEENCDKETSVVCEVCGKLFASQADFFQHQHVEEPLFPCNICDRSFTTSHNLKRHKLLHVKDGRKCHKCGVLFCLLHNHVLFKPRPATEQDSSMTESDHSSDLDDNAQSTVTTPPMQTVTVQAAVPAPPSRRPLQLTYNPLPPPSHTRILSEVPLPVLIKDPVQPPPPPPPPPPQLIPKYSRNYYPEDIVKPDLPASLKMFSPLYLTSAFLEVKRDYEYILRKSGEAEMVIVKEEPCERPLTPLSGKTIKCRMEENDRIAYDLEIVI